MNQRFWQTLPWIAALAASTFFFTWSARDWFFTRYDSVEYAPYFVSYAANGELVNRFASDGGQWDAAPQARLVDHGFLPAMLVGTLLPAPSFRALHFAVSVIASATLLLFVPLVRRFAVRDSGSPAWGNLLAALAVGFLAYVLQRYFGRPEIFALCFGLVTVHGFLRTHGRVRTAVAGIGLAFLAVSHPPAAVISGTIFLGHVAWTESWRRAAATLALAAIVVVAVMAVCLWWYPYPALDWMRGVGRSAAEVYRWSARPVLFLHWAIFPFWGLRGVVFAVVLLTALAWMWRRRGEAAQPNAVGACVAVLFVEIWFLAARQGFNVYNFDWLTALALPLPLAALTHVRWRGGRRIASATFAAILLTSNVALLREHLMRRGALDAGFTAASVRDVLARLHEEFPNAGGALSPTLFHLAPPEARAFASENGADHAARAPDVAYLVVAQNDSYANVPDVRPGWILREDRFNDEPLRAFGLEFPLTAKPMTYAYAVYVRSP